MPAGTCSRLSCPCALQGVSRSLAPGVGSGGRYVEPDVRCILSGLYRGLAFALTMWFLCSPGCEFSSTAWTLTPCVSCLRVHSRPLTVLLQG